MRSLGEIFPAVTALVAGADAMRLEVDIRRVVAVMVAGAFLGCVLAAPASARADPIASQSDEATSAALFVLQKLGNYGANSNAGNSFGQLLIQLGLGNASLPRLLEIEAALNRIGAQLTRINQRLDQLDARVAQLSCQNSVEGLGDNLAAITNAWSKVGEQIGTANDGLDSNREVELSRELKTEIAEALKGRSAGTIMVRIHQALMGIGRFPSLIDNCGEAFEKLTRFVTSTLRDQVVGLVDFWQTIEAQAAVLDIARILDQTDNSEATRRAAAQRVYAQAQSNFREETARIKPSLRNMMFDRTTERLWQRTWSSNVAAGRAASVTGGEPGLGGSWGLPSLYDLKLLASGCCGPIHQSVIRWFASLRTPALPATAGSPLFTITLGVGNTQLVSRDRRNAGSPSNVMFWTLNIGGGYPFEDTVRPTASVYADRTLFGTGDAWRRFIYG